MTFSHGFLHGLLESLQGLRAFGTTIAMKAAMPGWPGHATLATLDPAYPACGGFFTFFRSLKGCDFAIFAWQGIPFALTARSLATDARSVVMLENLGKQE
jgi:hypothetical protein